LNGKIGARDTETNEDDRPKREFERPRWSTKDGQDEGERNDDQFSRHARDAQSRAKFDQPWIRRGDEDASREGPAWRRNPRDKEHERIDTAPEWVDSAEIIEPGKAHTHEDFLQWMENMKNRTTGESKQSQEEVQQNSVAAPLPGIPGSRIVSDPTASVDKFFAKFEEQKAGDDSKGSAKPTKSRFASIFGAKEEPKPEAETPPTYMTPPPPPTELEQLMAKKTDPNGKSNDAAFAKLLQMLNKNNVPSATQSPQIQATRSPINTAETASSRPFEAAPQVSNQAQTRTPIQSHTPNLSLDHLIESRSPADYPQRSQAKATPQDLLDLLRRTNLEDRQQQQQQQQQSYNHTQEPRMPPPPPGLFGSLTQDQERQGPPLVSTRRENLRSPFEDMMYAGPTYRNEVEYQQPVPRQQRGSLGELLAAMGSSSYPPISQQEPRSAQAQAPNLPPGLQRPPGLDSGPRPPPGWPTNTKQQPQAPPASSRSIPGYPPQQLYNQTSYSQNQQAQQPQPQRMPQRKPTNELNIPPGFAGNIGVPPGFGPSPPYVSPTSPDNANQFGPRGGYAYNNERERLDRQQLQQQLFPGMYGNGNRGNGGLGMPPGFR